MIHKIHNVSDSPNKKTRKKTMANKIRLLKEFTELYQSRMQIVLEEYAPKFEKVAVCTRCAGKIVPDMKIEYLGRDEILARVDKSKSGVPGAMALFDNANREEIPFAVFFDDGDVLVQTMRVVIRT
tara:strand:- start:232 stop:609 length:378 start_codon:yes stop_codon:yes gene_type:complete